MDFQFKEPGMSLEKLFPQKGGSWFIWVLLLLIVFPYYYAYSNPAAFPARFGDFQKEYQDAWQRCEARRELCAIEQGDLRFYYDVPRYVADFWAMPLTIRVERKVQGAASTSSKAKAGQLPLVVSLEFSPTDKVGDFLIQTNRSFALSENNSIILPDLPPGGQANAIFYVRAYKMQTADPVIYFNGLPIGSPTTAKVSFNRKEVFRLWVIENLLSPPGANIFLPIGILLFVRLGELTYTLMQKCRRELFDLRRELRSFFHSKFPSKRFRFAHYFSSLPLRHLIYLICFLLFINHKRKWLFNLSLAPVLIVGLIVIRQVWSEVFVMLVYLSLGAALLGMCWGAHAPLSPSNRRFNVWLWRKPYPWRKHAQRRVP